MQHYKVPENQKCTQWPQNELEHLTVKSTLYTLNTYPWGPNCGPFHSTISHFRDTRCTSSVKIGNVPNDPKLNLNTWTRFWYKRSWKIGNASNDPNWTWTPNSQKYSINTKYLPQWPNFSPFHSTISRLRDTRCTSSVKIGNVPNDPKLNLNTWTRFWYKRSWKIGNASNDPNWTWTPNSQKNSINTKYLPPVTKL